MNCVVLRSNPVRPDPRVEKEIRCMSAIMDSILVLCWDRNSDISTIEINKMNYCNIRYERIGIKSIFGGGIKKNLIPLLKFQINLFLCLLKNRKQYDIIHACDFDTAFIAVLVKVLLRKKLVYDIFDYYVDAFNVPKRLKSLISYLDDFVMEHADKIIICLENRIEQIKKRPNPDIVVIHNTPERKLIKVNKVNKTNKVKLVYVGVLQKGRLLEEMLDIAINDSELELHIAGFGILSDKIENIARNNENIKFYGKVSYDKTLELEANCDIITAIYDPSIPNHRYAAPNKFYEALMLGKPLIVVENTGIDKIVNKYKIGSVITYSREGLEEGIKSIIHERDRWPEIAKKMERLYYEQYSWDIMKVRLIRLYKEIEATL